MSIEKDRLIAEFLEYKKIGFLWKTEDPRLRKCIFDGENSHSFDYDSDWNSLIPVIKKIYNLDIDWDWSNLIGDITHAYLDCDIQGTYDAVSIFLKIYNTNK